MQKDTSNQDYPRKTGLFAHLEYSSFALMDTVISEALRAIPKLQRIVSTELLPWVITTNILALMRPSLGRDKEGTWHIPRFYNQISLYLFFVNG